MRADEREPGRVQAAIEENGEHGRRLALDALEPGEPERGRSRGERARQFDFGAQFRHAACGERGCRTQIFIGLGAVDADVLAYPIAPAALGALLERAGRSAEHARLRARALGRILEAGLAGRIVPPEECGHGFTSNFQIGGKDAPFTSKMQIGGKTRDCRVRGNGVFRLLAFESAAPIRTRVRL